MTIYSGFTHWKWWFSIVMLVYHWLATQVAFRPSGWASGEPCTSQRCRRDAPRIGVSKRCRKGAKTVMGPETKVGITGIITRKDEFSPAEMATLNISTWYLGYESWRTGLSNPWVEPALTESRFPPPARQQWKLVVTCGWCWGKELFHSSKRRRRSHRWKPSIPGDLVSCRWCRLPIMIMSLRLPHRILCFSIGGHPFWIRWMHPPNSHDFWQAKLASAAKTGGMPKWHQAQLYSKAWKTFVTMVRTIH